MESDLQYIKRADLDEKKYTACIEKSPNAMIYAYPWYLDIVCDDWVVLVYQDYQAVMPVPYLKLKRHLWRRKIYSPDWVQQLGVFAKTSIDEEVYRKFYQELLKLKPKTYHFNFFDTKAYFGSVNELKERVNYELDLRVPYEDLYSKYHKIRKRDVKKLTQNNLIINTEITTKAFFDFFETHANFSLNKPSLRKMKVLVEAAVLKKKAKIYSVFFQSELVSVIFVLENSNRLITILSTTNQKGRELKANIFLLDYLIKENAGTSTILDFEGSMIPGVARFYKSFGGEEVNYLSLY